MKRQAWAEIDLQALQANFAYAQVLASQSKVVAVIKADAYGHGVLACAKALEASEAFAVSCISEGKVLRDAGFSQEIWVLQGARSIAELQQALAFDLRVVVHQSQQLQALLSSQCFPKLALKLDTGMHRLGFQAHEFPQVIRQLKEVIPLRDVVIMSHFACADEPEHVLNQQQMTQFSQAIQSIDADEASLANSAALFAFPEAHYAWVRPGLMLYGASPLLAPGAEAEVLQAVMSVYAPVVALKTISAGESVGYGATWVADTERQIAVLGIGYGDGYPRHAQTGTPVWLNGRCCSLVGRVSMDMITVDVSDVTVKVGDIAELWGKNLSVNAVAQASGTIAYELMCSLGAHVQRNYSNVETPSFSP